MDEALGLGSLDEALGLRINDNPNPNPNIKKALTGINDEYQATECGSTSTVRDSLGRPPRGLGSASAAQPQRLSLSRAAQQALLYSGALNRKGPFA